GHHHQLIHQQITLMLRLMLEPPTKRRLVIWERLRCGRELIVMRRGRIVCLTLVVEAVIRQSCSPSQLTFQKILTRHYRN
ncbi:hypothetical protein GW879_01645, partial [Candidatus Kaiserbacteria bacterium]|nr:hypothetical protein [Candidatus Kaiserbacteria bacterium]